MRSSLVIFYRNSGSSYCSFQSHSYMQKLYITVCQYNTWHCCFVPLYVTPYKHTVIDYSSYSHIAPTAHHTNMVPDRLVGITNALICTDFVFCTYCNCFYSILLDMLCHGQLHFSTVHVVLVWLSIFQCTVCVLIVLYPFTSAFCPQWYD